MSITIIDIGDCELWSYDTVVHVVVRCIIYAMNDKLEVRIDDGDRPPLNCNEALKFQSIGDGECKNGKSVELLDDVTSFAICKYMALVSVASHDCSHFWCTWLSADVLTALQFSIRSCWVYGIADLAQSP